MKVLKSVYLLSAILVFTLSISVSSFAMGKDIWIIDGKEMDKLPDEVLRELQNDPYVREALGLDYIEEQKDNFLDENDYTDDNIDNIFNQNIPNTVNHIKTIDGANISNVLITGKNVGISIEKSLTDEFELDYVGVKDTNNFTFNDTINSDGRLEISISANSLVNYIDTSPNNKVNVVNVKIPEKAYSSFSIKIEKGAVYLPSIAGKVNIDSDKSSVKVMANQLESDLNLNIQQSSLKFNVAQINNDIDIEGIDTGNSVKMILNENPKNLKLDVTKCKGSIDLPTGWGKNYEIGTNKPVVNLNIKGSIKISVDSSQPNRDFYKIMSELTGGGTVSGAGNYWPIQQNISQLQIIVENARPNLEKSIYNAKNLIDSDNARIGDLIYATVDLSNSITEYSQNNSQKFWPLYKHSKVVKVDRWVIRKQSKSN